MKKILAMILVAMLCIGLVACKTEKPGNETTNSTSSTQTTATENPNPPEKKILTIARNGDSWDFDPITQDGNPNIWVYLNCWEPLIRTTDDCADVQPALAESYDVSTDGLTYTFHMPEGLVFSSGEPVLAEDYVWSYERLLNAPESPWNGYVGNIKSVEAPDNLTFIVHVFEASPVDIPTFTFFCLVILDKSEIERIGEEALHSADGVSGTGPYMFKEWVVNDHVTLVKNPHYRNADSVKVDEITWLVVPDDNTRIMQLQAGEIDVCEFVPFNRMAELDAAAGIKAIAFDSTEVRDMRLNTKFDNLKDVNVRKALCMAIDLQAMVDNVTYGIGQAATSILPPGVPYSEQNLKTVSYDPEAAKQLLADAGYPDGFKLTITVPTGNTVFEQTATILKDQWSKIGVDAAIDLLEIGTLREKRGSLQLEVCFNGWLSDIPDPSQEIDYYCVWEVSKCCFTDWQDVEMEKLIQEALYEMDTTKRAKLYSEIQQMYYDGFAVFALFYLPTPVAISDKVTGFVQTPAGEYRFSNLDISK